MTEIDDKVRSLLASAAEQITPGSIPPLRLPRAASRRLPLGVRRWPAWLAPVAAATAVAAIAIAAVVISNGVAHRPRPAGAADFSVPPYYIALTSSHHEYGAAIFATRTGAVIARIAVPGKNVPIIGVSAAADDRTFAIAAAEGPPGKTGNPRTRFYLVRFSPLTREVRLKLIPKLQIPPGTPFRSMSLSPSGTKLAVNNFGYATANSSITDILEIMNLTTGAIRTWTSSAGEVQIGNGSADFSWTSDERTVGFSWYGFTLHPERTLPTAGFWLLDLAKPSSDLLADSHRVLVFKLKNFNFTLDGSYVATYPMMAADGRTIAITLTSKPSDTRGFVWFATFDAANGRIEHTFARLSMSKAHLAPNMYVIWTGQHADALIVDPPAGHNGHFGIVRQTGQVTVLPADQGQRLLPPPAW